MVNIQVGPQARQAAERLLCAAILLFQEVHKVQHFPSVSQEANRAVFREPLLDGHKISRKLLLIPLVDAIPN